MRRLAVGRLSSRALGRGILGVRVALSFHSVALELNVYHLADGVKELHSVFREPLCLIGLPPSFF